MGAYFIQFILFFPLDFVNNFQLKITRFLFGNFTEFVLKTVFNRRNVRIDYSSDSASMLVLLIILCCTSVVFSFCLRKKWIGKFLLITEYFCAIYISIILIKYGLDKIFKTQFPEPEPNILFTRFGNLDKDILFWSTIGTSKTYNIITGSFEVFTGILLWSKRTQFLGLLLAVACFCQILIINVSFDISVKFFSSVLLVMNVFLLRKNGWELLVKIISQPARSFFDQKKFLPFKTFIKIIVLGVIFIKIVMPYFLGKVDYTEQNSFHFDKTYQVISPESPYQYVFFHKDQYLILMEKNSEKMKALHYEISFDHQLILEDDTQNISKSSFFKNEKTKIISFYFENKKIDAKVINFKNMNALQDRFHLLVD